MCEGSFLPEALVLKPRLPDSIEPSLLSNQGLAGFARPGTCLPPPLPRRPF